MASQPEQEIRDQVAAWLRELAELRQYERPLHEAAPAEVHSALIQVRGRLDRMESIAGSLASARSAAQSRARVLQDVAGDAWDALADQESRSGARREWEGKEERYGRWRVATFDQIRAARQAVLLADLLADADARAARMLRGLQQVREELLATLRYLPWESALER